jgi:Zn-finger nucleic acid-binding protein
MSAASSITCPACSSPMTEHTFEGHYGRTVLIDLCSGCNGLWFDAMESHQLTPGATLRLFRQMGQAVSQANRPMGARKPCPRCHRQLTRALDKQRSTTFEDFRCPDGHGRYMTFVSFLRAKNFVRDLTPAEVNELRRHVRSIKCASCGGAVDITKESACSYCRAPIAMLDPDQLATTVAALEASEARRQQVDPSWPLRLAHERLKTERLFAELGDKSRLAPLAFSAESLVDTGLLSLGRLLEHLGHD